jgi:opacity protein-like surface antigen
MKAVKTCALTLSLLSFQCFSQWLPVITASLGINRNDLGISQTINLDGFPNTYIPNTGRTQRQAMFGIFGGFEHHGHGDKFSSHYSNWRYQVGLGVYQNEASHVTGVVNEFGLPQFNNLNFKYYVRSRYVMAEGRVLYIFKDVLVPYVMAGAGVTRNNVDNYFETPRINTAVPMAPFRNNASNLITYGVGAGVELILVPNVRIGGGYRYQDLGSGRLDPSPAQTTTNTFYAGKIQSHQILFQVTAIA